MIIYPLPSEFSLDDSWSQPRKREGPSAFVARVGSRLIETVAETEDEALRQLIKMGHTRFTELRRK